MSNMLKGIEDYNPCNLGVFCDARYMGKKLSKIVEEKLNLYRHDVAHGVFNWQVDERGIRAILESSLTYLEPTEPCVVWWKSDGLKEPKQESWKVSNRIQNSPDAANCGTDRATWLHNLATSTIISLQIKLWCSYFCRPR